MASNTKPLPEIDNEYLVFPPEDPALYDAWFQQQVELGLKEADDPNTQMVDHADVIDDLEKMRAEWRARTQGERDAA